MKQQSDDNLSRRQQEGLQHMEDRMQLLDMVREMIDAEFDRRNQCQRNCLRPEIQALKSLRKPTLWQRIRTFFHRSGGGRKKA
ncbi:hypothetical protein [Porphyromonas endodontalis]|jgi:hypothetical protein|uniref:hypothetical protein n=1 Tax=Porphyromonas endodontalis TaxID=28124 RepID=UPI0028E6FA35|nr:hypothetical protein [Porphyromonas endodontalis]